MWELSKVTGLCSLDDWYLMTSECLFMKLNIMSKGGCWQRDVFVFWKLPSKIFTFKSLSLDDGWQFSLIWMLMVALPLS